MLTEYATKRWLTEEYDYDPPRYGQMRDGVILKLETRGITVDIGLKRDGFVPQEDVECLEEEVVSELKPGQEVTTRIVQAEDVNGNLILSLYQAQQVKDWAKAQDLFEGDEIWTGKVTGYNQGGLLVSFGQLQAFVPTSHLWGKNRQDLSPTQRQATLQEYVGQELSFKVIEVDQDRNRLVLSERMAKQQIRRQSITRLLNELMEGEVRRGTVRQLCKFGAFVDLGGVDGLIHNSELAWHRVQHPSQVLQVGDEIEVYILRLDYERKQISLSLKRLQPNPWAFVSETYTEGQLVPGVVTNLVEFGAFALLDIGLEGLIHISELADPQPQTPQEVVRQGDELVLRILSIDPFRYRLGLSLKRVSAQERDEWLAQQDKDKE